MRCLSYYHSFSEFVTKHDFLLQDIILAKEFASIHFGLVQIVSLYRFVIFAASNRAKTTADKRATLMATFCGTCSIAQEDENCGDLQTTLEARDV